MKKLIILIIFMTVVSGFSQDSYQIGKSFVTIYGTTVRELGLGKHFISVFQDTIYGKIVKRFEQIKLTLEMIPDSLKELIIDEFFIQGDFDRTVDVEGISPDPDNLVYIYEVYERNTGRIKTWKGTDKKQRTIIYSDTTFKRIKK